MVGTRPAAKEVADVASHGAQDLLGICGQKLNGARIKRNDLEWNPTQTAR